MLCVIPEALSPNTQTERPRSFGCRGRPALVKSDAGAGRVHGGAVQYWTGPVLDKSGRMSSIRS